MGSEMCIRDRRTRAGLPPGDDAELPVLWLGALPRASLPSAARERDDDDGVDGAGELLVAHDASGAGGAAAAVPIYASAERDAPPLLELRLPTRRAHDAAKWLHRGIAAYAALPP